MLLWHPLVVIEPERPSEEHRRFIKFRSFWSWMEAEQNVFIEILGDTPVIRVLDFLITGRDYDYTLTDLATKAGVSWSTLHRIFPGFISRKVVVEVRTVGRAKLYKLNLDNPLAGRMVDLYDSLLLETLKNSAEAEMVALTASSRRV